MRFTFSDLIAGYVIGYNNEKRIFSLRTSDDRIFDIGLGENLCSEIIRNLGEGFIDCTHKIADMIKEGIYVHVNVIFYPQEENYIVEAKHIMFFGENVDEYRFEHHDWWINQVRSLADFYLKAQFKNREIDFAKYRTNINIYGDTLGNCQESHTISRFIFDFATAYMLTGNEMYLEVAEKGTIYLQEHMKNVLDDDVVIWNHASFIENNVEKKVLASSFADDYNTIPAYEQIYSISGLAQTYRINGDPYILNDIDKTINLFSKYYLDKAKGGYFSHLDPISLDFRDENLDRHRARKNFNSIVDHIPAYLINLFLATGEKKYKDMLEYIVKIIIEYFQDDNICPFIKEKFYKDWNHDKTSGWQQNRGLIGHNLKTAWNLVRINNLIPDERHMQFLKRIAEVMPKVGSDHQRGGWYDVIERETIKGEIFHRFAFHDLKAWWQQEQGILTYLILAGILEKPEYLKLARESSAFYNAWFLDHDCGGIYSYVQANGIPYLLGIERSKGSHSMGGYHIFELAYYAAVYINLIIVKKTMDFYFKPYPNAFKDNILRVQPDILPKGSIKIIKVSIDDKNYYDFDSDTLEIRLPSVVDRVKVKVTLGGK